MKNLVKVGCWVLLLAISAAACTEDQGEPKMVDLDTDFNIAFGEEAIIRNESVRIKFTEVNEDSRCPENVNCVWEGRLQITLNINGENMQLSIGGSSEPSKTLNGYKYSLVRVVAPTPNSNVTPDNSEYVVSLLVEKV
ncbi:MAG: hypothetical protein JXQ96_05700 [Cyclobacteriaceae bacterium]